MERNLRRLIRKNGLINVLEVIARICRKDAEELAKAGKRMTRKTKRTEWREEGFNVATKLRRGHRGLTVVIGELRREDPTDLPVARD